MNDTRNLLTTIVLTLAILLGYQYFFAGPEQQAEQARQEQLKAQAEKNGEEIPSFDSSSSTPSQIPSETREVSLDRDEVLNSRAKITINSPRLKGSIALKGARIDDLTLSDYKETLDDDSLNVALLSPEGTDQEYYAEFGWGIVGAKGPDRNSVWTADKTVLEAEDHVTLTWDNGAGLLFSRTIALDENYMFTVSQKITNTTNAAVKVAQYGRLVRKGRPEGQILYILHEGPMWSLDEGIKEFSYSDLEDMKKGGKENTARATNGFVRRPDRNSVWTADKTVLEAEDHVTLTWDNGAGLLFSRTIALDENYMFTVSQKITNTTNAAVKVAQYGRLVRKGRPEGQILYILHEGPMWSLDEGIKEFSYSDLEDMKKGGKENTARATNGGWVGITDKYWHLALIPDPEKEFNVDIFRRSDGSSEKFYADYIHVGTTLGAGTSYEEKTRLFAGAKVVSLLDRYTEEENVKLLNYSIDWGMFYFLTKPIFYLLEILYAFAGNFGIAILLLTAIVKLALFPLANKGYKSMNKMKVLQPKMQALKEKYGDDKVKMQQATMELYKKEKVNPVSGCLPMFLQFPVFFALYKVLYVTIDMRHAPFFGWIKDLSGPDTMLVTNFFGLIPWEPTGFLALGILPIFMGFTMWLQMQMNPSSGDPMQRKIMLFMPIVFTFMLSQFSVGLVIYWTFSNILGILQQWILMQDSQNVSAVPGVLRAL